MQTSVDERHGLGLRPAGNDTVYVDRSEREIISIQFPVEVIASFRVGFERVFKHSFDSL